MEAHLHDPTDSLAPRISLRPAEPGDADLNYRIFADSRALEISLTGWNAEQAEVFLRHQFTAQNNHYWHYYPASTLDLILLDRDPAGRLWVDRSGDEIRILDLVVLVPARGQGIGTVIIRQLQAEATSSARQVLVHVEVNNPSRKLFQELGFQLQEDKGAHLLLAWTPVPTT